MNAPGKGLLKVSGILLIIFAVIGAIGGLAVGGLAIAAGAPGLAILMVLSVFAGVALNLIAGILGVKNADKPEKAQVCFILGVVMVALQVISAVISIAGRTFQWYSVVIGLVLPILYLVGALKNKEVSTTGVEGASVIDQAKDAISDAQADIKSGAIKEQVQEAKADTVEGAKEISGEVVAEAKELGGKAVAEGKEVVDKVTKK